MPDGVGTARMVATPCDFSGTPWEQRSTAPDLGEHSVEVLESLGFSGDDIRSITAQWGNKLKRIAALFRWDVVAVMIAALSLALLGSCSDGFDSSEDFGYDD